MSKIEIKELVKAGVHFGHLTRKWNPNMSPYIYSEKNGIHIINLYKTVNKLEEACSALEKISSSGRKILFVATKKQAKEIISSKVEEINMPSITERWPGGMLTNFKTTRKTVKKMSAIDKMMKDGTADTMSKRERLQLTRQREKIGKVFGSISDMNRLPAAIFIVDVKKEHIALAEARNLNIPVFAMVDTNSNPNYIDFVIPSNDDATKSIDLIISNLCDAIKEGLGERKQIKDKVAQEKAAKEAKAVESAESTEKTKEEVKS